MLKMSDERLIYVNIPGGVLGFPPAEIAEFEMAFEEMKPFIDIEDLYDSKWAFFNEYFEDVVCFREAFGYSSLWYDGEAWDEYEEILDEMKRKK